MTFHLMCVHIIFSSVSAAWEISAHSIDHITCANNSHLVAYFSSQVHFRVI